MKIEKRKKWINFGENQKSKPSLTFWPENKEDIVHIIKQAEQNNVQVRAIGSSHSFSDVAKTHDYLVRMDKMDRIMDIDEYNFESNTNFDKRYLMHVEAGITVRALNKQLHARGLALKNMGGFDGQTISGVISTSTHGSGINFLPLSDFVKSIEIISDGGKLYRIEHSQKSGLSLTDATKFKQDYPDKNKAELIQDDDWFNSTVVSMGCTGIIYSLVLEVRDKFLLKETRTMTTWEDVKRDLENGEVYNTPEHYELLLNPYKVDGKNACLITTRIETNKAGDRERSIYIKYKFVLDISALWIKILSWIWPSKIKNNLNTAISLLEDKDYTNDSFKVFHIGEANDIVVISSEFAVPVKDDAYIEAIEHLFSVVEEIGKKRKIYLSVPIAIRFVKATDIYLSPQSGRDTCMIEVIALKGIKKSEQIMYQIEEALQKYEVRPHWGQINHVTKDRIIQMYGKNFTIWQRIHDKLNSRGTFHSPFTKRVGIN